MMNILYIHIYIYLAFFVAQVEIPNDSGIGGPCDILYDVWFGWPTGGPTNYQVDERRAIAK
jgi:hypothetical protein